MSGVPQGSVLGPILFNFHINDLFYFITQATLYNYADDNTISYFSKTIPDLVNVLEKESKTALNWLENNHMIANPEKFHALIVKKNQENTSGQLINIKDKQIKTEEQVKLLGVNIDFQLNFDHHISKLCNKLQLN